MIVFAFMPTTSEVTVAADYAVAIGAPVKANGVLANDANATGILLEVKGSYVAGRYVNKATIMTAGYVDTSAAQTAWGSTYADAAKGAMPGIVWCDNHRIPQTPNELPTYAAADAGKVLTVTAEGALAWVAAE